MKQYLPRNAKPLIISNGVEITSQKECLQQDDYRKVQSIPYGVKLVGYVGRLSPEKGVDVLIDALKILGRTDVHLVLAGSGPEQNNLKDQIENLSLTSQVHFVGYEKNVSRVFNIIDVYVQSSRFEGMPISVLEAMVEGCPVVVTNVDGNKEVVVDGESGWVVPSENSSQMAQAVHRVLENPDEVARRTNNAVIRVSSQYSIDEKIREWRQILE